MYPFGFDTFFGKYSTVSHKGDGFQPDRVLIGLQKLEVGRNCDKCGAAQMELRDIDDGPPVLVCSRFYSAKSASAYDFARWSEGA